MAAQTDGITIEALKGRVAECFAFDASQPTPLLVAAQDREIDAKALEFAEKAGLASTSGSFQHAVGDAGFCGVLRIGEKSDDFRNAFGGLAAKLSPEEVYALALEGDEWLEAGFAFGLGRYRYNRYKAQPKMLGRLAASASPSARAELEASLLGVYLARDMVNTPANAMGPADLENVFHNVAASFDAESSAVIGDALIEQNFPMIHAVGRAGGQAPRLLDMRWRGSKAGDDAPTVTLVGKGVCFDTGGLDIKPSSAMRNMKKDMGGAAAVLGLATILMALDAPIALRVLIPAVENNIAANAFRPGDVLRSRKGLTVEIGNTDAEGRLVLADALAYADEEAPDFLIDMATLTGAARVALGPDLAPFYTADDATAAAVFAAGEQTRDRLWRMPLHEGYNADLASTVADMNNISPGGFAGSITAALFLQRFVRDAGVWAHFDIFAWNPKTKPGRPEGGEATAVRALARFILDRFAA